MTICTCIVDSRARVQKKVHRIKNQSSPGNKKKSLTALSFELIVQALRIKINSYKYQKSFSVTNTFFGEKKHNISYFLAKQSVLLLCKKCPGVQLNKLWHQTFNFRGV